MAAAKRALRTLDRRTQSLEQEIALLLTAAADHPERFRSDAGFATLWGVSPLPASAGKTKRHRLNRGGNRQANAALHRIAVVRLRWHEQTQAYAARRTEQGRSKPEILRCLKRFIAREVYRILLGG
jgi:transposase